MLATHIMNILLWGTIMPPECDASGFATSNDTSGLPAGEYVVTGPILDFYNIFECEQFKSQKHYNNQIQS